MKGFRILITGSHGETMLDTAEQFQNKELAAEWADQYVYEVLKVRDESEFELEIVELERGC